MQVAIRTDASLDIGTGHVMRCLTLADELRARGATCRFVCRAHSGHLLDLVRQRGFESRTLPTGVGYNQNDREKIEQTPFHAGWLGADWVTDADQTLAALGDMSVDWLITDHYAIDSRWELRVRPVCKRLIVIDDLADRPHDCDFLLDQNLGRQGSDYTNLVSTECKVYTGPRYALLRSEFAELRSYSLARRKRSQFKHLLISMGGVDKDNATGKVLEVLQKCYLPAGCRITVVMGPSAPWADDVRNQCQSLPWAATVLVNTHDMAQLMADSDLAIGAAGMTSWERCCLGVPALIVTLAENQVQGATALMQSGCVKLLGDINTIRANLGPALETMIENNNMDSFSKVSSSITDGQGCCRIVKDMLISTDQTYNIREARREDESLLFSWANDELTRKNSLNPDPISISTHCAWFQKRLGVPDSCCIYIIENYNSGAIGQVRFELVHQGRWEIDYAVAPSFRGMRMGEQILRMALGMFRKKHSGATVVGHVRLENMASCRVFEALNFESSMNELDGLKVFKKILT